MPYEPAVVAPLSTMPVAAPPVTVGSILGRTFSTWWKRMWIFAAATLAVMVPLYALLFALVIAASDVQWAEDMAPMGFTVLLVLGLVVLACGHTYGAVLHLGGRPVRLGAMLSVAFGRFFALVGLAFLGAVAYVACAFAVAAAAALMNMFLGSFVAGLVLVLALLPLCCVVGTAFSLTIPVMASERTGPITGLRRSWVLTRGRRAALFLSLLVMILVLIAAYIVLMVVATTTFGAMMRPPAPSSGSDSPGFGLAFIVMGLLFLLVQVLVAPLFTLVPAVAYHDVRIEKEGVSTDELARVFQ